MSCYFPSSFSNSVFFHSSLTQHYLQYIHVHGWKFITFSLTLIKVKLFVYISWNTFLCNLLIKPFIYDYNKLYKLLYTSAIVFFVNFWLVPSNSFFSGWKFGIFTTHLGLFQFLNFSLWRYNIRITVSVICTFCRLGINFTSPFSMICDIWTIYNVKFCVNNLDTIYKYKFMTFVKLHLMDSMLTYL